MEKTKRYCKGCEADVTQSMFCGCGENALTKEMTYTETELNEMMNNNLNYNDPNHGDERINVKRLTTEESAKAVELLDEALHFFDDEDKRLVQRFIHRYENLEYFEAIHSGDEQG